MVVGWREKACLINVNEGETQVPAGLPYGSKIVYIRLPMVGVFTDLLVKIKKNFKL